MAATGKLWEEEKPRDLLKFPRVSTAHFMGPPASLNIPSSYRGLLISHRLTARTENQGPGPGTCTFVIETPTTGVKQQFPIRMHPTGATLAFWLVTVGDRVSGYYWETSSKLLSIL